ncbi:MAG: dimethylsulfonioproprionate lyase family protein [Granulosicoccus sp.]
MHQRSPELKQFLDSLHHAIVTKSSTGSRAHFVTEKIMNALSEPKMPASPINHMLPLCTLIDDVVNNLSAEPTVKQHAKALRALAPSLKWWHRSDASEIGEPFASGHANTTVIGPGGLEERDDVWIGISLLAPDIDYPVHHHPPEEVYLVLSPGEWQQNNGDWHEPGVGGIVHNPPDILHAMRSGKKPLLATWCLLAHTA